MNALRKIQVVEHAPATVATVVGPPAPRLRVVARNPVEALAAPEAGGNAARNIALFLLAPFIGLAYIVAMPFVGMAALAVLAARAAARNRTVRTAGVALKHGVMMIGAPLVGLAYVVILPFAGLAALAWIGGRAAVGRTGRNLR